MTIFFGVLGAFVGILYAILNTRLTSSMKRVKMLEGMLSICCVCKCIRDDDTGELESPRWVSVEAYISGRADVDFSHTYCPKCYEKAMAESEQFECKTD